MHEALPFARKNTATFLAGSCRRSILFPIFLAEVYFLKSQKDYFLREKQSLQPQFPASLEDFIEASETFPVAISSIQAQLLTGCSRRDSEKTQIGRASCRERVKIKVVVET